MGPLGESVYKTALTALLWSIAELARVLEDDWRLLPAEIEFDKAEREIVAALDDKSQPRSTLAKRVLAAYRLARPGVQPTAHPASPEETLFAPIAAYVSLTDKKLADPKVWHRPLASPGEINYEMSFPDQKGPCISRYRELWKTTKEELARFPMAAGDYMTMSGLLDLLASTLGRFPAPVYGDASPAQSISQYNVAHLMAALAVCLIPVQETILDGLAEPSKESLESPEPVARLVKLDLSGIQSFIYRITEPRQEGEYKHTSKRLRGRSLHLSLLNRALGDWLLQEIDLPPTNLFQDSGGIIEFLAPADQQTRENLIKALDRMESGLWQEFGDSIGLVWSDVELVPGDLADMAKCRARLEDQIARAKSTKWEQRMSDPEFFEPAELFHTCPVCDLTPQASENQICDVCELHRRIGQALVTADTLAWTQAKDGIGIEVPLPGDLEGVLALVTTDQAKRKVQRPMLLRGVNQIPRGEPDTFIPGRWGIANAAPRVGDTTADFDQIAALSEGVPRLGVLKADADHMGLAMSHGLSPLTFASNHALSQAVHQFFGPYLNQLACKLTQQWQSKLSASKRKELHEDKIDPGQLQSLFYIVYAGGDDLFIIGPWDQTIDLALALAEDFARYTCGNAALAISAGISFVRPHLPVQQFARMAEDNLEEAKDQGRDRISLFGKTVPWGRARELVDLGKEWTRGIRTEKLRRSLIHDVLGMARQYRTTSGSPKPMFTPHLYYTLARRLSSRSKDESTKLAQQILEAYEHISIPASYALWKTRKM